MPFASLKDRREYDRKRYREGHQVQVRKINFTMRVPEGWIALWQQMLHEGMSRGSGRWKTVQEVARSVMVEGMEAMRGKNERLTKYLPKMRFEQNLMDLDRDRREAESLFAMSKQNIRSLINIDADIEALRCFGTAIQSARQLPSTIWSTWLIAQLEKAYPALARRERIGEMPGVRLRSKAKLEDFSSKSRLKEGR